MFKSSTGAALIGMSQKDITYNPAQADQYVQLDEPELPDFLLHFDEEEDPMPALP